MFPQPFKGAFGKRGEMNPVCDVLFAKSGAGGAQVVDIGFGARGPRASGFDGLVPLRSG